MGRERSAWAGGNGKRIRKPPLSERDQLEEFVMPLSVQKRMLERSDRSHLAHTAVRSARAEKAAVSGTRRQRIATRVGCVPMLRESDSLRDLRARHHGQKLVAGASQPAVVSSWAGATAGSGTFMTEIEGGGTAEPFTGLSLDRTKFRLDEEIVTEIMMKLPVERCQNDFERHGDNLTVHQFVEIMMQYQPEQQDHERELKIVSNLRELFAQVDINGDGNMEWDEFMSFIVDSAQDRHSFGVDNIKQYHPSAINADFTVSYKAGSDGTIDHVYYVEELDHLIVCDGASRSFHVYAAEGCERLHTVKGHNGVVLGVDQLSGRDSSSYVVTSSNDCTIRFWDPVTYELCQQMPTSAVQMALEWSGPQHQLLFSAGIDGLVNLWDVNELMPVGTMRGHTDVVMDLHAIRGMDVVASASLDSQIRLWDMPTQTLRKTLPGHSKGVFSLSYNPEYRFLFSAGFDHDAIVWNPYSEGQICRLKGHTSSLVGVCTVPNTPEIITADCEGIFKVWDIRNWECVQTFQDDDLAYGGRKRGAGRHTGGGVLSGHSNVRSEPALSCFTYATRHKRVVAGSRKLHFFDYDQPADPQLSDQAAPVRVIFNSTSLTFVTAAGPSVKLWDAQSGRLLRIYRNICTTEITAICLDDRQRKFIIGDHAGDVMVFNLSNGALMKGLTAHDTEVVALLYCIESRVVISASWDGVVKLTLESDPDKGILLRKMSYHASMAQQMHENPLMRKRYHMMHSIDPAAAAASAAAATNGTATSGSRPTPSGGAAVATATTTLTSAVSSRSTGPTGGRRSSVAMRRAARSSFVTTGGADGDKDVTALAFSFGLSLVAAGASDYCVCIWDMETSKIDGMCVGHTSEVTCVAFLSPYPVMLSADNEGNLLLWAMRPHRWHHQCLLRFKNRTRVSKSESSEAAETESRRNTISVGASAESRARLTDPVTAMAWSPSEHALYAADEKGVVRVWSLLPALRQLNMRPFDRSKYDGSEATSKAGLGNSLMQRSRTMVPGVGDEVTPVTTPEASPIGGMGRKAESLGGKALNHAMSGRDLSFGLGSPQSSARKLNSTKRLNSSNSMSDTKALSRLKSFSTYSKANSGRSIAGGGIYERAPMLSASHAVELKCSWNAHADAVRSLELIETARTPAVATTSYDRMAVIWSRDGRRLGTLFQGSSQDRYTDPHWHFDVDREARKRKDLEESEQVTC